MFFAMVSLWHLLHMPPVEALPKKPQPAEQRVGADVSGGAWSEFMDALLRRGGAWLQLKEHDHVASYT